MKCMLDLSIYISKCYILGALSYKMKVFKYIIETILQSSSPYNTILSAYILRTLNTYGLSPQGWVQLWKAIL